MFVFFFFFSLSHSFLFSFLLSCLEAVRKDGFFRSALLSIFTCKHTHSCNYTLAHIEIDTHTHVHTHTYTVFTHTTYRRVCLKTDERENEWRRDGGKGKQEKEKERNKKVKKFENHVRIFLSGIEAGYLLECSRLCSSIRLPQVLSLPSREFDFLSIIIIFFPLTLCRDVVPASCIKHTFLIQYEGHS